MLFELCVVVEEMLRKRSTQNQKQSVKENYCIRDIQLKNDVSQLIKEVGEYQNFSQERNKMRIFLKAIRKEFEEFYNNVEESIELFIQQQEENDYLERLKQNLRSIQTKGIESPSQEMFFYVTQCCQGVVLKELQVLQQQKSIKSEILTQFYSDMELSFKELKQRQTITFQKLIYPDTFVGRKHNHDKNPSCLMNENLSLSLAQLALNSFPYSSTFQGKRVYNFEFNLEETQSVLLKDENQLILIGEHLKIWDNVQRKITYEKKIEQVHEYQNQRYSIGWGQFSVLGSQQLVIGNNNSRQIFIFSITPFKLVQVLNEQQSEDQSQILQNSSTNQQSLTNNSLSLTQDDFIIAEEQDIRSYSHFILINSNTMACSSQLDTVLVYDLTNSKLIHCLKTSEQEKKISCLIRINSIVFATHCENDLKLKFWNAQSGQHMRSLILPCKQIQNIWMFKKQLYVVSFKNTIYVYNLNSLKLIRQLQLSSQVVLSKQLSEHFLVGIQNYNEVFVMSLDDFAIKKVIKMDCQVTDIIIFNSRVFATFNICSESRKGKIEYLQ